MTGENERTVRGNASMIFDMDEKMVEEIVDWQGKERIKTPHIRKFVKKIKDKENSFHDRSFIHGYAIGRLIAMNEQEAEQSSVLKALLEKVMR